ncbi:GNAT family N-acetyltransferase [Capsulimonas corticalis]|uniref:GNAT family N-acetyltransferase n=1 Tax=Capsulimonas corticalis TaxID=2219043 RepID=A0A402CSI6_9BACT|nr:GNAT family N-acetyltransferase [Capsulimonas corticalis]BDI31070.1 GNAT family N-acetyltransferase [Capsulimonas corticalis]
MTKITICELDHKDATEAEYEAFTILSNQIKVEELPDEPPLLVEDIKTELQNFPESLFIKSWVGWIDDTAQFASNGVVWFTNDKENTHAIHFLIRTIPAYRRHGLGRQMLQMVVNSAREKGRTLMITSTNGRVPAGEAFMKRLGAERALENRSSQLNLADVDMSLIERWQSGVNDSKFALGFWDGPYPDEHIEAIAELTNMTNNSAPRDNLSLNDFHKTPAQLREEEYEILRSGAQRWTAYIVDRETGAFAGFTQVLWHPNRPEIVGQDGTGVFPSFRGKGLGRWLKAATVDRILRERPEAKSVRTGNAYSNAAMLRINDELGFKPCNSICTWQVETEKAAAYLAESEQQDTPGLLTE